MHRCVYAKMAILNRRVMAAMREVARAHQLAVALIIMLAHMTLAPSLALAGPFLVNDDSVAASGYDTVAYINSGRAIPGKPDYQAEALGAKWYFHTAENLALFQQSPEKYAPAYGGYCAYAASYGSLATSDPHAFSVVDGVLYLNYSLGVRNRWRKDVPGNISRANGNWPKLKGKAQ